MTARSRCWSSSWRSIVTASLVWLASSAMLNAQSLSRPLPILDVPYLSQSEVLCGGAAAAMVLRYWGARGLSSESFASLLDRSEAGIGTVALVADVRRRGWNATAVRGTDAVLAGELEAGRPVLALVQDRPGRFHYVVVVGAADAAIVFHDPARSPYRVMRRDAFMARWDAADRWMAVILPPASADVPLAMPEDGRPASAIDGRREASDAAPSRTPADAMSADCADRVAGGIVRAQAGDLAGAERLLVSAVSCPGSGALRELAGVRLLQRRWADVSELAGAAVTEDPNDGYAWRLLGTSEFLQDRPLAALSAWNRVQEPHVDLVRVNGLTRTRSRVIEDAMGIAIGDVLTPARYTSARRRVAEVPAVAAARLAYIPVSSDVIELEASIVERPIAPTRWTFAALAVSAAASREMRVTVGSLTGGGEALSLRWRFWPDRPLVGARVLAPAPWGGTWGVDATTERQPFDLAALRPARRTAVRMVGSQWVTGAVRVAGRIGFEQWRGKTHERHAAVGGSVRLASRRDRVTAVIDVDAWRGSGSFATGGAALTLRSSMEPRGLVVLGSAGVRLATRDAPEDLWPGGDSGHARAILLRAHPVLDGGALKVSRLGRRVAHGSIEAARWWQAPLATSVAAAVFVDLARTGERLNRPPMTDIDIGVGARISAPGVPGVIRVDVAHGVRDGANAVSLVYTP